MKQTLGESNIRGGCCYFDRSTAINTQRNQATIPDFSMAALQQRGNGRKQLRQKLVALIDEAIAILDEEMVQTMTEDQHQSSFGEKE